MQPADGSPLVSVIVPAYNAEEYIAETLQSVLAQTYTNLEVLVVDDGSTDQTASVVEAIARKDSRIQLLRQANSGVAAARNLAIARSRGEFISPIDADDIWFRCKIERQVQRLLESPQEVGLIYTWSLVLNEDGTICGASNPSEFEGDVYVDLVFSNFVGNSSTPVMRRSCIERVGGYDCQFKAAGAQGCEDWDLYLRIAEQYEFRVVSDYLVGYRIMGTNMSANYLEMERSYRIIMEKIGDRHPGIPLALLRWSRSKMYYFLHCKSCESGDLPVSLLWLARSIQYDPLRILSFKIYKTLVACFLHGFLKIWNARSVRKLRWPQAGKALRQFRDGSASEMRERIDSFRRRTLYERIRRKQVAFMRHRAPQFARLWAH